MHGNCWQRLQGGRAFSMEDLTQAFAKVDSEPNNIK